MDSTFGISVDTASGTVTVSVVGELDVATAPGLRSCLETTIGQHAPAPVIVDLLGVTFIDSTALGVLIASLKQSQATGGELRLVIAEPRIRKVFEITGLTELFAIYPTIGDADVG